MLVKSPTGPGYVYEWELYGKDESYEPTSAVLKRYGLTRKEFNSRLKQQGFACAICEETLYRPQIDHNHTTGTARGLLCVRCNSRLVYALESPFLAAAKKYLKKWNKK